MAASMSRLLYRKRFPVFLTRHYCSSFVQKVKMLQCLKEDDSALVASIETSQYLIFDSCSKILLKADKENVKNTTVVWATFPEASQLCSDIKSKSVLLDVTEKGSLQFALDLTENLEITDKFGASFYSMPMAVMFLPWKQASLVSQGSSLLNWHKNFTFCSRCGGATIRNVAGSQKSCLSCKTVHYPLAQPVAITLVSDRSNENILLVRQPRFPPGMYSCISGYIELGETLEVSVKREIAEEVGLEASEMRYVSSQHWPFPVSNLMMGFSAIAEEDRKLNVDHKELEDARWFSRKEVKEAFDSIVHDPKGVLKNYKEKGQIWFPPPGAIAHQLIKNWLQITAM